MPIVLVTGATGNLGRSVAGALAGDYRIVGLNRKTKDSAPDPAFPIFEVDFSVDASAVQALRCFRDSYGSRIASVVHLAAYFDFTGEDNPKYQSVNFDGTRRLLRALQDFEVEQFVERAGGQVVNLKKLIMIVELHRHGLSVSAICRAHRTRRRFGQSCT